MRMGLRKSVFSFELIHIGKNSTNVNVVVFGVN